MLFLIQNILEPRWLWILPFKNFGDLAWGRVSWRHLIHGWHNFVPALGPSAFCFIIFHVNFQDYTILLVNCTLRITQIKQIIRIWTLCAAGECCLWRAQGKTGTSPGRWGERAGCGTGSLAFISSLDAVLGLVPGMLLVVTGLDKSPFVTQREHGFSLKHFLLYLISLGQQCHAFQKSLRCSGAVWHFPSPEVF